MRTGVGFAVELAGYRQEGFFTKEVFVKVHFTFRRARQVFQIQRRNAEQARVRHTLAQALHRFFDEQGYFWVSTPLITASDTEGAGEMFRVSTLDLER